MADRFYRATFNYVVGGQAMANVLHFHGDDSVLDFSPMTAQGLADHLGAGALVDAWRAFIPLGDTFTDVTVREMLGPGDTSVPDEGVHALNVAGLRSGVDGEMPLPACGLIKVRTGRATRSGHGHWFMPPIFDSNEIAGQRLIHIAEYYVALGNTVSELNHWTRDGSAWSSSGSWGISVYSRTRRLRLESEFAFHANAFTFGDEVHWLRSRSAY